MTTPESLERARIDAFATRVSARVDEVVRILSDLADEVLAGADDVEREFNDLSRRTRQLMSERPVGDMLAGLGFAADYADGDPSPATIWWVPRNDTVVERTHGAEPDAESFYDYARLRWFQAPKVTGQPVLSGPFIDAWGSDDYTVTVSVPMSRSGSFRGVLTADIDVRRFIKTLTEDLRGITTSLALVNEADRVVVANTPMLSTGLPLRPRRLRHETSGELGRIPIGMLGWSVVMLRS